MDVEVDSTNRNAAEIGAAREIILFRAIGRTPSGSMLQTREYMCILSFGCKQELDEHSYLVLRPFCWFNCV